jgi:hypothetical protein
MSDPLAEDYKSSLEDLINNDRSQILNLTMIASENIKQAEAISRVIVNHIYRVGIFIDPSAGSSYILLTAIRLLHLANYRRCTCSTPL